MRPVKGRAKLEKQPRQLVKDDPIWKRQAKDDLRDAEMAIKAHDHLFVRCEELRDEGISALQQVRAAMRARNFTQLERNWETYERSLTNLLYTREEYTKLVREQNHGLAYTCYAYQMEARENRKMRRVHAGNHCGIYYTSNLFIALTLFKKTSLSTALEERRVRLEDIFEETPDRLEDEHIQVLCRFAERLEKERKEKEEQGEIPFAWNPKKNRSINTKALGLTGKLKWPPGIENYANNYIGIHGDLVPESTRGKEDLQQFRTLVYCGSTSSNIGVSTS